MAENDASSGEKKEILFDHNDLTPFERIMIGNSIEVAIDRDKILVGSEVFEKLQENKNALRIILTPINLTEVRKTLEEIRQARMHGEISTGVLCLFEGKPQIEYIQSDICFTLKPGELDQNGQLKTFGIYFSQNEQKIDLPEKAPEEIVVKDGFKDLVKYAGSVDGIMQYKINTGEGK